MQWIYGIFRRRVETAFTGWARAAAPMKKAAQGPLFRMVKTRFRCSSMQAPRRRARRMRFPAAGGFRMRLGTRPVEVGVLRTLRTGLVAGRIGEAVGHFG